MRQKLARVSRPLVFLALSFLLPESVRDLIFVQCCVMAHMYLSPVWSTYHTRVEEQLDISLKDLGTDYLDLFLIHCKSFSLHVSYNFAYRQYRQGPLP
jgi:aryl-alcohol dehydrogenase-like predicted oxidoreductase